MEGNSCLADSLHKPQRLKTFETPCDGFELAQAESAGSYFPLTQVLIVKSAEPAA
jgi:hypothetical protein